MKAPRMTRILSFFLALVFCLYLVPTEALAAELLKDNILIKDLSGKIDNGKQYIRIAIRDREDNEKLQRALAKRL